MVFFPHSGPMVDDLNCSFDSSAPWPPITSTQLWINAKSTYSAPNPRLLSSTKEKSTQPCKTASLSIHGPHPGLGPLLVFGQLSLPYFLMTNPNPQESPQPHTHHYPQQTTLPPYYRKLGASAITTFKFMSPHTLPAFPVQTYLYPHWLIYLFLSQRVKLPPSFPRTSLDPIHSFTHLIDKVTECLLCDNHGSRPVNKADKLMKLRF